MPRFSIDELATLASSKNIAEFLKKDELEDIGSEVISNFEQDDGKMDEKRNQWQEILDLALQIREEKNFPWAGASNMKFPLITDACISFSARTYPEIVRSDRVARVKTHGEDPEGTKQDRALRVEEHLNFQITEKIKNWEADTDILLSLLPLYGCYYKKVYFDQVENRPYVEICNPATISTSQNSSCLEEEERINQPFTLTKNQIIERIRAGLYLNVDLRTQGNEGEDTKTPEETERNTEDFIEQHCWLDLDQDDYKEPYIVTAHKESKVVVRIVARFGEDDIETTQIKEKEVIRKINAFTHYVRYIFFPAFDGSKMGYGFGELLIALNEQVNSNINQLTDAGTMQNLASNSGFIGKGMQMDETPFRLSLGEYMPVETRGGSIRDNIFPLPAGEPSQTLFALLGLMLDTAQKLSASQNVAPGEIPMNTPATTILAVIEEGMKVYSSIYKRIFNSIKEELRKIFYLNKMYGDPEEYAQFFDNPEVNMFEDYECENEDISPVASPEVSSDMHRLMRAQGLLTVAESPVGQAGGLDPREVIRRYLEATHETNIEDVQPPPEPPQKSIDETLIELQAELQATKLEQDEKELQIKELSEYVKAMKTLAEAESMEAGEQVKQYQAAIQAISDILEAERKAEELQNQQLQPAQPQQPSPQQPQGTPTP